MAGPSGGARWPLLPLLLRPRPPPPRSSPGPPRRTGGSAAAAAGPARLKGPEELPGPGLLRTFVWLFLRGYLLHTHRLQVRRGSPARGCGRAGLGLRGGLATLLGGVAAEEGSEGCVGWRGCRGCCREGAVPGGALQGREWVRAGDKGRCAPGRGLAADK